ncbi:AP-4 complex subunit sigma-1 isoform X1 [Betta splendens]|uniref:AP complex subunit sigma n=1 Tax=Betta splendens TaxID=158456 RepID=A0A6P7LKS5_BETSP|nr:AP-4 complex subunit sigma-1 isoform X1 [Betta splendens]
MIKFVLMVNRQGQTRLSRYYQPVELNRRATLEADVVRCCLSRKKEQVPEVNTTCGLYTLEPRSATVLCLPTVFVCGVQRLQTGLPSVRGPVHCGRCDRLRASITCHVSQNELSIYELVHNFVEVLDKYFSRVSELDVSFHLTNSSFLKTTGFVLQIMFNLDRVHIILDEMIQNGHIVETNKSRILAPLTALDKMTSS